MIRNQVRRGIALFAGFVLVLGAAPARVLAVTPIAGGPLSATNYAIGVDPSLDANDPHVSGDLATYTADSWVIRYYSFLTAAVAAVPPAPFSVDVLADVSNGRIVFSRLAGGSSRIMVFDTSAMTTTEIDPQPSGFRFMAAIGSDTVAFIDQTSTTTGNLHAAFLGGAASQITNDGRITAKPSVAPPGGLIVFESCATDALLCSIRQATWNGSSWVVSNITSDGTEAELNPDTDGTFVVYDADRGDDREIAWQPVGGGAEQVLSMAGLQTNPSINAGIVTFESVAPGETTADLFVYEIANNRLFQVTSSPGIDDTLTDVTVLPGGTVRAVWAEGPESDRDVRGADLVLPPVEPQYSFGGFLQPVDPIPTLNAVKAGAAIPVKFSLGGDQGLDIFVGGYPRAQSIDCESGADVDGIEQTVSAGGSSLTYDPILDVYTYVWKTDKASAGSCRQLVLSFAEGTIARANFKFR
jgi:hypothetical protein